MILNAMLHDTDGQNFGDGQGIASHCIETCHMRPELSNYTQVISATKAV